MNTILDVESALRWLLTYSLHSAVLAAVGLVLVKLWLGPGSRRGVVLKVALFGALVSASSPWKLTAPFSWTEASAVRMVDVVPGAMMSEGVSSRSLAEQSPARLTAAGQAASPAAPATRGWQALSTPMLPWLLAAILAGSLALVGHLVYQRRRFLGSLESVPLDDVESHQLLDAWTGEASMPRVALTSSDRLRAPVALSRGEICVPRTCWEALSAEDRRAVLAHEFAHIERRDPLWFSAAAVTERLFFFLPWHRSLRKRLNASAEVACDALAAKRVGSSTAVARCLASVATWSASDHAGFAVPASVPAMAAGPGELVDRVRYLLAEQERPVGRRFAVGAVLGLVGFACCAPAITGSEESVVATDAMGVRGDIEVAVSLDGTATARRSADYPPMPPIAVQLGGREGKEALGDWLAKAAEDLPAIVPPGFDATGIDWDIHGGALVISGERDVEMKHALHIMSLAGARQVSMPDVRLAVAGRTYRVPLPVDLGAEAMMKVVGLDVRLDAVDPADPSGAVKYQVASALKDAGPSVPMEEEEDSEPVPAPAVRTADTSDEVEDILVEFVKPRDRDASGIVATLDARKGVRFGTVADLLQLLEKHDIAPVTFKGSYEQ